MKSLNFEIPQYKNPREMLCAKMDELDYTFNGAIESVKEEVYIERDRAKEGKNPNEVNMYLHLRIELEKVLTERVPEEIEDIMVRSRHWGEDPERRFDKYWMRRLEYGYKAIEFFYREIYKDDPEFKPELMKHTKEELDVFLDNKEDVEEAKRKAKPWKGWYQFWK